MKRILTAAVLIPAVLAGVFWLPLWIFSVFVGVVALLAAAELFGIAAAAGLAPLRNVGFCFIALLFIAYPLTSNNKADLAVFGERTLAVPLSPLLGLALLLLCCFAALAAAMRRDDFRGALADVAVTTFAVPYSALTLGSLVLLRDLRFGPWWILYLFVVVWTGDTFAYYTGRAIGRHKLAPRVSPGKTWEGTAASLIASVVFGALMFQYQPQVTGWLANIKALTRGSLVAPAWWQGAVLAAVLNVAAQTGDLAESMMKRSAGVKDSGTLLPGHGGMLDRIDALLFAAPVLWYYAFFVNI